ncbi:MAG TPA: hypothetical protein VK504_27235 [Vicinamibacterales bacterium]|nr:hypothetical protein [Vicinamibacterales bacterium]
MTFLELQDRIMDRLNLSTDEARARIKNFINERVRNIQTSCNMARVRRGTITITTTNGVETLPALVDDDDPDLVIIKPLTAKIPLSPGGFPPLSEITLDAIRRSPEASPARPHTYAVTGFGASGCALRLYPTPDDAYEILIDGLLLGVDLVDDDDVPAMPEDFHDAILFGALADEYDHFDKAPLAAKQEKKFEKRVGELRYFIAKSTYLERVQGRRMETVWWWRPLI